MTTSHEHEFIQDQEHFLRAAGTRALRDRIENLALVNSQIRDEGKYNNDRLDRKRLEAYYLLERVIKNDDIKKKQRLWLYQNLLALIEPNPAETVHFEQLMREHSVVPDPAETMEDPNG